MSKKKKQKKKKEKEALLEKRVTKDSNKWIRQTKWMTQALIVSGALNICLGASFIYKTVKDKSKALNFAYRPVLNTVQTSSDLHSLKQALTQYSNITYDQLVAQLDNTNELEGHFLVRDAALAILVKNFDFDLYKALSGQEISKNIITNVSGEKTFVFTGLTDSHYELIKYFSQTEKWPFTSKGIFKRLQKEGIESDSSLKDTFYLSSEFMLVEALFNRANLTVQREVLASLLIEGGWDPLSTFCEKQRKQQDLSSSANIAFLLEYISKASPTAAHLLIKLHPKYSIGSLADDALLTLLGLLSQKSEVAVRFATELLTTSRSDLVWQKAGALLYSYAGEVMPEPYDHIATLIHFASNIPAEEDFKEAGSFTQPAKDHQYLSMPSSEGSAEKLYVVQDGDNLWKIAKYFSIEIDSLKAKNQLQSDLIKPGDVLVIP